MLNDLIVWETALLADLGYGLDLTSCAVTGETSGLAYVSPRTGRAVTEAGAGIWTSRLLRLPGFLAGGSTAGTIGADLAGADPAGANTAGADPADWRDGLALTGHFLARDAFGTQHRPLPRARQMLYDRIAALANESSTTESTTTGGSDAG
jgi:DNA repair protein RecO (recombination protein O)